MPLVSPVTSRRQALGLSSAAYAAKIFPAAAPPAPDAELLDLCRQLDADSQDLRHHDLLCATHAPTLMNEDEVVDVLWRAHDAIELIAATPATTTAGIRAKATALRQALMQAVGVATGLTFEEQAEDYELLAMSLARDIDRVHHG
jgi:hypothetical protein